MIDPDSPVYLSAEVTHGWTDRFETGVLLETAPSAGDDHALFTAGTLVPRSDLGGQWRHIRFHVSSSLEIALFKQPGAAQFRQALAVVPILERHTSVFEMSINPGLQIRVRCGSHPVFELSAKIASKTTGSLWLGVEYYAETGPMKHKSHPRRGALPVVERVSESGPTATNMRRLHGLSS